MARREKLDPIEAMEEAQRAFVVPDGVLPMVELLTQFWEWVAEGKCLIRPKRGGKLIPLVPNKSQRRIYEALLKQAKAGQPLRIIILKPRQHGASTFIQAIVYFFGKTIPQIHAMTIAHADDSTREIFGILRTMYMHDKGKVESVTASNRKELSYSHGSRAALATAGGRYIGSGMTLQILVEEELSKWEGDVEDQCTSVENALSADPMSFHAIASTANRMDVSGIYEARWRLATAGKFSGFAPVFVSWLDVEEYQRPDDKVELPLLDYEMEYVEKYGATLAQIAWYRHTLGTRSRGTMMMDFPTTPEEAFQVAKGRIYPMLRDERHNCRIENLDGWKLYRGIDWGAVHPFVCLWVAARDGCGTGMTIDKFACPELWASMANWCWDGDGKLEGRRGTTRPRDDKWKDCNDALRYVVSQYVLTGRVHVYREMVIHDSGTKNMSEADLARDVLAASGGERYTGTVADRSRTNSINTFNKMKIPTCAKTQPTNSIIGEIEDGIAMIHTLLVGSVDLAQKIPPPPSFWDKLKKVQNWGRRSGVRVGTLAEDVIDVQGKDGVASGLIKGGHPFLGRSRRSFFRKIV